MKAKVKETGEVIEVEKIIEYSEIPGTSFGADYEYYKDGVNQKKYNEDELDFINVYPDWQQVRIQAAISTMQGILANEKRDGTIEDIAFASVRYTDALIEELKKNPINNK